MDAAVSGDSFAVVGVTRHPSRHDDVAVRYVRVWVPPKGGQLDFSGPEAEVRRLCREYSVVEVTYDPYQLHDMAMRLRREGIANVREFSQAGPRMKADKQLQDLILTRRIAHDGNPILRQHIDNANVHRGREEGIRLVKRSASSKIDAAVALSMAVDRCLYYAI